MGLRVSWRVGETEGGAGWRTGASDGEEDAGSDEKIERGCAARGVGGHRSRRCRDRARAHPGGRNDGREGDAAKRRFAGHATPPRAEGAAGAGARAMSAADIVANLARVGSLARAPRGAWSGEGAKE